jgi:hypothetical protein
MPDKIILRLERNETEYWELVAYSIYGRDILKNHGEFRERKDAISYAYTFLLDDDFKFCFEEPHHV